MDNKMIFEKRDAIISQLNAKDLSYEDLNQIQVYLINNSHTVLGDLVFKKEELKDEEFIFYMPSSELYDCIERGNGKIDREFCQYHNDGIWFYTFDKAKDIILNYMLYDALFELNANIVEFLVDKFNLTY